MKNIVNDARWGNKRYENKTDGIKNIALEILLVTYSVFGDIFGIWWHRHYLVMCDFMTLEAKGIKSAKAKIGVLRLWRSKGAIQKVMHNRGGGPTPLILGPWPLTKNLLAMGLHDGPKYVGLTFLLSSSPGNVMKQTSSYFWELLFFITIFLQCRFQSDFQLF